MDKIFLRLVRFFDPVLEKAGVNLDQLHEILRVKLLMDNRRPRNLFSKRRSGGTGKVTSPIMITFFTVLMGFFISMLLWFNDIPLAGQTFYFVVFMVILTLTIVSDFTTVLLDSRDQFILLPRPVDDRTIAVSRILHITVYVLRLALLQGLPGMIMVGFVDKSPFASIIFLVQILEATFLCILFVNLIYLAFMRSVNGQKFKDMIGYFQMALSTIMMASYYMIQARVIDIRVLLKTSLLVHWWAYFLPPVWIAALNQTLMHPLSQNLYTSLLAVVGLVTPLAGLWFVIKVLAPGFNRKLAILATSDGNPTTSSDVKKVYKQDFRDKIANFIAPRPVENAGFRITYKLASRTREFKMKTYPAFAYVPIMFLYFTLGRGRGGTLMERLIQVQHGSSYVFLVYLSTIVLTSLLTQISMSEKYKSAWVYYALPVEKPGEILSGMYKALVMLYFLPFCVILSIATVCVWGPQAINDLILAFLLSTFYGVLIALFTMKGLPFSKPVLAKQGGGRAISNLVTLGLLGILGFGHYLLAKYETLIWIAIIPAAILLWVTLHYYRKQTWDNIENYDEDMGPAPQKKPVPLKFKSQ